MRLGIDLGGTKIEGVLLDAQGQILRRQRLPTPQGDYAATLETLMRLVRELAADHPRLPVGIGTPGAVSALTGRMKNCNSTCLNGQHLRDDLQALLRRPVRLANDADCFALSEATDGAAAGAASVFGVILGTGVGGGWVIHGRLLQGPNGIAGEWGHNPLAGVSQEAPRPCYCGREHCVETFLSGPGLSLTHQRLHQESASAEQLAQRWQQGEAKACESFAHYLDHLAAALATVINSVDPEVIVLGGGLSRIEALYRELPARLAPRVFSDELCTRIVPPRFGDSSGVRGAAWLW